MIKNQQQQQPRGNQKYRVVTNTTQVAETNAFSVQHISNNDTGSHGSSNEEQRSWSPKPHPSDNQSDMVTKSLFIYDSQGYCKNEQAATLDDEKSSPIAEQLRKPFNHGEGSKMSCPASDQKHDQHHQQDSIFNESQMPPRLNAMTLFAFRVSALF